MPVVTMVMEQVHERACEQQQVGENPEQVSPMLCEQEEECDGKEPGQDPFGPGGHAAGMFSVAWWMHGDSPCSVIYLKAYGHSWTA
jgi:hypothetical protein